MSKPEARTYHYREKMEKLMRMDFELLNTVLGIEINPQMNPAVIQSVIKRRITELSTEEKRAIPEMVVEIIMAIGGDFACKEFEKYLKADRPRPKPEPVAKVAPEPEPLKPAPEPPKEGVQFHSLRAGVLSITWHGKTGLELSRRLANSGAWGTYSVANNVRVNVSGDALLLSAPIFRDFPAEKIGEVFRRQFKFGL